jgi:hypothetical protein
MIAVVVNKIVQNLHQKPICLTTCSCSTCWYRVFLNHQNLKENRDEGCSSTFEPAPFLKHLLLKSFGKVMGKSAALIKYAPIKLIHPLLSRFSRHSDCRIPHPSLFPRSFACFRWALPDYRWCRYLTVPEEGKFSFRTWSSIPRATFSTETKSSTPFHIEDLGVLCIFFE